MSCHKHVLPWQIANLNMTAGNVFQGSSPSSFKPFAYRNRFIDWCDWTSLIVCFQPDTFRSIIFVCVVCILWLLKLWLLIAAHCFVVHTAYVQTKFPMAEARLLKASMTEKLKEFGSRVTGPTTSASDVHSDWVSCVCYCLCEKTDSNIVDSIILQYYFLLLLIICEYKNGNAVCRKSCEMFLLGTIGFDLFYANVYAVFYVLYYILSVTVQL